MYFCDNESAPDLGIGKRVTYFNLENSEDEKIINFLYEYYDVPESIKQNVWSICQVPKHIYGHLHTTWNKPDEQNDSILVIHLDRKITPNEFDEASKNKNFVEFWTDGKFEQAIVYKLTPVTKIDIYDLENNIKESFGCSRNIAIDFIGKLAEIGVVLLKESKKQK